MMVKGVSCRRLPFVEWSEEVKNHGFVEVFFDKMIEIRHKKRHPQGLAASGCFCRRCKPLHIVVVPFYLDTDIISGEAPFCKRERGKMRSEALKIAQEHVLFHHNNADGWVSVAHRDAKTGKFSQFHYQPEELADALTEWTGENVYFSQNTFYKPRRATENIRQLRALYVDMDVYNLDLPIDWILSKLEYEYFGDILPDPNTIIFSGRGLVLVWNIEPVPYQAIPLWRAVERHFVDTLAELGADTRASDPSRIFRVAGSVNTKSGTMVQADFRHTYRYNLRDLQYEYLPELNPPSEVKRGRKTKLVHLYNVYTLHLARLKDIAKLVELRDGDVGNCRENICFLYRYYNCCFTDDPEDALQCTLELNDTFKHPLAKREVISATKSAEKAWSAKSDAEANRIAREKGYPGAGYNLKNSTIIEWLYITEEEQRHLSTIIGPKEKNRRRKEERHKNGTLPREEYLKQEAQKTQDKQQAILSAIMDNPKASIRELSAITGLSKSAVQRLKASM